VGHVRPRDEDTRSRRLRNHIISAFEVAESIPDPAQRTPVLTFVVVGSGATCCQRA